MQRLNKKKGYSLVEQLCALAVFSILSITVISIELNNIRLEKYNRQIMNYTSVMEALKQEMLHNCTYDNVKELGTFDRKYISSDRLSLSSIKSSSINQLFTQSSDQSDTYLLLKITEGEVLKVQMELHIKLGYKEEIIECAFYKGNYI